MQATILIAVGGAFGSVLRYWISRAMEPVSHALPWSTILTNIIGSLAISFFAALTAGDGRYPASDMWRLAFMVGLCGGFTTFSSFSMQSIDLLRAGAPGRALINICISVCLCLAATALGYALATRLNSTSPRDLSTSVEHRTR